MKRKIFFILFILGLIFACGIIYLNKVVLPIKVKSLVISRLQAATQKKVGLKEIEFHIFKGLVLRDLILYDGKEAVVKVKEASCSLLNLPILRKRVIVTQIQIKNLSCRGFLGYFQNLGISLLNSDLKVGLQYDLKNEQLINGSLDIFKAKIKLDKIDAPIEDIGGRLEFNPKQIKWLDLDFKYKGAPYKTGGSWVDFKNPAVQLVLSSKELALTSDFVFKDKLMNISKCQGQYLNSKFWLQGNIDTKETPRWDADISGILSIDLKDIKSPDSRKSGIPTLSGKVGIPTSREKINPEGIVHGKFNVNGNIKDIKTCGVMARFSSPTVSFYGLKATKFFLNYNQANGLADILAMHLSLYDGAMEINARMNLNSKNFPFWISADIQGVKIEKLKTDTPAKEKDIAGIISIQTKINGFLSDLGRLNGKGEILVKEGRLWQLNLFKGLGELIFAKEFGQVIFKEGSCGFIIQDKYIWTNNLRLKSDFIDLTGSCSIDFDSSIDASLNMEVLDVSVPTTGSLKDITTTILGQAGRFAVIKITGTLKEPKYEFRVAVMDIIKGLKDAIKGNIE